MKPPLNATWLWLHSKRRRIYPHTTRIWLQSYLNRPKRGRRIAARYDKYAHRFLGFPGLFKYLALATVKGQRALTIQSVCRAARSPVGQVEGC